LRLNWIEVMRLAEQAAQFRPDDDMVQLIKADAQNYLDCYDGTERRPLTLLHTFPDSADLVGPIVHGGVDLYTLDRANGVIYHDTLSETGDSLTTRDNTPIIRQGQVINNYTIGELFDLEWLGSGGTVHDNVLIALDRNGVLVSYSPTFFASAQQIVIENRWRNPVAMAVFRTNFYVLDIGSNQIWRYVPPIGERRYSNAPEEYFNGDELPDLSHAVDLGISDEGSVFILFDDGTVHKYRRNTQSIPELQPFEYREKPPGALVSGRALFVDNDPASRQLYIVDAQNQTVYETFWAGTFQHGYRPRYQPEAFADLTGVYVDVDARNNIYVLSGDKLYQFRRNPQ
jgi:hypothetical protein